MLKPSEVSVHTSAIVKKLADKYLDHEAVQTIEGGVEVTQTILKQPFDYVNKEQDDNE